MSRFHGSLCIGPSPYESKTVRKRERTKRNKQLSYCRETVLQAGLVITKSGTL